jgi:hypothetical protein
VTKGDVVGINDEALVAVGPRLGEGVAVDVSLALGVTVGNANGGETNRLGETDVNGDVAGDGLGDGLGLGDGVGVGGGVGGGIKFCQ